MMSAAKIRNAAIAVLLLLTTAACAVVLLGHANLTAAATLDPYGQAVRTDSYGQEVVAVESGGKPPAVKVPAAEVPVPDIAAGINVLSNVPAYDWSYGCSATSAAMLFGYYDRMGFSDMYTGPANGGVCPLDNSLWGDTVYPGVTCHECPLSATHVGVDGRATRGHVDDYWIDYGDAGPDPHVGNWAEHIWGDCTGDYMGTNQSDVGNVDGSTVFFFKEDGDPLYDFIESEPEYIDGCHGMKDFAVSRGYAVRANFNQYIRGQGSDPLKGFTFSQYTNEIDAGRPVLIQLAGHTMLGFGYDTAGSIVYVRDTWDHNSHQMTWGGTYSGMQHRGVTVIQLDHLVAIATSGLVSSHPATVHYVQAGVPKTATTYGTWSSYVDYGSTLSIDSAVAVSSTERYATDATTSWIATEAATHLVPYYHQFKLSVATVTEGIAHTDMGAANFATLNYYRFASTGTHSVFDAQSFSDWVDAGSTASLSNPSSASTSTHRWYAPETTSWTISDASSLSVTYWDQLKLAMSVVTAGAGHTDMGITNCATLTCSRFGSPGTFSVFDAQSFSDWVDASSTASLSGLSSASTSTHRWYASGTTSWTINNASSLSATYWDQVKPDISVVTAGTGHADLGSTNNAVLTFRRFGAAGTSGIFDAQGFSDWIDTGSTASLSNPSSASNSTHRWHAPGITSWTINNASPLSATYWEQLKPTISTVTAGSGHKDLDGTNYATLTCDRFGAAWVSVVFDAQSFNDWLDTGSTASLSGLSSASTSTHHWCTDGITSWTITDSDSRYATYWDQVKPTISTVTAGSSHKDLDSTNYATLTYDRFGTAWVSVVFDAQNFNDWLDTGSTASLSNPSSASTDTHRWYSPGTISWSIGDTKPCSATYWEQYQVGVVETAGLPSPHPATITFTRDGSTASLTASEAWTDWSDAGSTLSLTKSVEGGWIGDWSTSDTTDWTVDSPISASVRYHRSYVGLYVLVGVLLAVAMMIGIGLFLLITIRRKGYGLRDLPGLFSDRLGS